MTRVSSERAIGKQLLVCIVLSCPVACGRSFIHGRKPRRFHMLQLIHLAAVGTALTNPAEPLPALLRTLHTFGKNRSFNQRITWYGIYMKEFAYHCSSKCPTHLYVVQ